MTTRHAIDPAALARHRLWLAVAPGGQRLLRPRAELTGADLTGADLTDADLRDADLTDAVLTGADLTDAVLRGADLTGAVLTGADLTDAVLRGADLTGADLTGANLTGADLTDADLTGAVLTGADLTDADLTGADLSGADLSGANGLPRGVPVVPHIDAAICAALDAGGTLTMDSWHTCQTTHCRAGWAIQLAGARGYALEDSVGPNAAGALIYAASRPSLPVPPFIDCDAAALADLRACAAADPLPEVSQ